MAGGNNNKKRVRVQTIVAKNRKKAAAKRLAASATVADKKLPAKKLKLSPTTALNNVAGAGEPTKFPTIQAQVSPKEVIGRAKSNYHKTSGSRLAVCKKNTIKKTINKGVTKSKGVGKKSIVTKTLGVGGNNVLTAPGLSKKKVSTAPGVLVKKKATPGKSGAQSTNSLPNANSNAKKRVRRPPANKWMDDEEEVYSSDADKENSEKKAHDDETGYQESEIIRLKRRVDETEKKLAIILSFIKNQYGEDHEIIQIVKASLGQPINEPLINNVGRSTPKSNVPMFSSTTKRTEYPRHAWVPVQTDALAESDFKKSFGLSKKDKTPEAKGVIEQQTRGLLALLEEEMKNDTKYSEKIDSRGSPNLTVAKWPLSIPSTSTNTSTFTEKTSVFASVYSSDEEDGNTTNNTNTNTNQMLAIAYPSHDTREAEEVAINEGFNQVQYLIPAQWLEPIVENPTVDDEVSPFQILSTTTIRPDEFRGTSSSISITKTGDLEYYNCTECNFRFVSLRQLTRHQEIHNKEKTRSSPAERVVSSLQNDNETQNQRRRGRKKKNPKVADNTTKQADNIKEKLSGNIKCDQCVKVFSTKSAYNYHKLIEHSTKKTVFLCSQCKKCYSSRIALRIHEKNQHNFDLQREFRCAKCSMTFGTAKLLLDHLKTHPAKSTSGTYSKTKPGSINRTDGSTFRLPPLKCEICNRLFESKANYDEHKKLYHQEPFKCSECGKAFTYSFALMRHQKVGCTGDRLEPVASTSTRHGHGNGYTGRRHSGLLDERKSRAVSPASSIIEVWSNMKR